LSTLQSPSADQLAAARFALWRQNIAEGDDTPAIALLTIESARQFVASFGLVLFAPRPQHIASPAPTFVEATLGASNSAPTLAESAVARTLLGRLIAEGSAVPLNLLGVPSTMPDAPDFIASAATFSYVFTLRGDKAWKQPPATSGASKVSPLALNTYNLLLDRGPTSAYDLVTQLGKEVTEPAVLRSLNELWQHLRVLPVPQTEGGVTLWETVANRFTKQLKSGANAGQPTALSALISLYLSQSLLATETEIETFLSPLAPRSRVRDVLHALTGARQIETVAIDGKTHLHIHGELPSFAADSSDSAQQTGSEQQADPAAPAIELAEDGTRIKKFVARPRKIGTGYVERAKPFSSMGRPPREARTFDRKGPPSGDRPSRPFDKSAGKSAGRSAGSYSARPAFNKPWDEEKQQRADRDAAQAAAGSRDQQLREVERQSQDVDLDATSASPSPSLAPQRPFTGKTRFAGDRPAPPRKPGFGGDRPGFSRNREDTPGGRPPRRELPPREGGETRPPRRDFSGPGKPPLGERKPFGKPAFGDRKREGFAGRPSSDRPPFRDRPSPAGRPAFADKEPRPFRRDDSTGEGRPPRREFTPREDGAGRPPRREFAPRPGGPARPPREGFSRPRPSPDRQTGEAQGRTGGPDRPTFRKFDAPRGSGKPFPPREGGDSRPPRRDFSGPGKPSFGPRKTFSKPFDRSGPGAPGHDAGFPPRREGGYAGKREGGGFPAKREGSGYADKHEAGSYAGKKPFGAKPGSFGGKKPFTGKPAGGRGADAPGASTFDKFKGGNKPWGKRPPGRKPKPDKGEA